MNNPRVTAKERGLIKGALRRVFSRSELRQQVLAEAAVKHSDLSRRRVKNWVNCAECGKFEARSNVAVDHKLPIIPVDSSMEAMTVDDIVNRIWCDKSNLQILCDACHDVKTKAENKERRRIKKEKKDGK